MVSTEAQLIQKEIGMLDVTLAFQKIEQLRVQLEKVQEILRKREDLLKEEIAKLEKNLVPICQKAVEEYNHAGGWIVPSSICVSVNREKKTLSLYVHLKYPDGSAPYDEFDFEDERKYSADFGAVLNRLLMEHSIPLTFGDLSFPSSYYLK